MSVMNRVESAKRLMNCYSRDVSRLTEEYAVRILECVDSCANDSPKGEIRVGVQGLLNAYLTKYNRMTSMYSKRLDKLLEN